MSSDDLSTASSEVTSLPALADDASGSTGTNVARNPYARQAAKGRQATRRGLEQTSPDEPLADIEAMDAEGSADDRKPQHPDPAVVCVKVMVRRALRGMRPAQKNSQLFVIQVAPSWAEELGWVWPNDAMKAWTSYGLDVPRLIHVSTGHGEGSSRRSEPSSSRLADALTEGQAVVGISPDPMHSLPRALTTAPDCVHLTVPAPDTAALRVVARAITGCRLPTTIDLPLMDQPTPEALRLACRRDQSPEAWLRRVADHMAERKPAEDGPRLDDMAGLDEAVAWGRSLARSLRAYAEGKLAWKDVDRGVLLFGPPGVGKTTIARAIARHCGVAFIATSYAQWQGRGDGHLGHVQQAIDQVFLDARERKPCVVFIDEIDALHTRGGRGHHPEWWHTIIAAVLEWLDGSRDREGVVVIAATNYLHEVDEGLRRAGRLDRVIEIRRPDAKALAGILRHHLGGDLPKADLLPAAERLEAPRATGADAERVVRDARRRARDAGRTTEPGDLLAATGSALLEPSSAHRWRVAVHEAGHAVVGAVQRPGHVPAVRITMQGWTGEAAMKLDGEPVTRAWIEATLREALAGRAAEEVVTGEVAAGAGGERGSDLGCGRAAVIS